MIVYWRRIALYLCTLAFVGWLAATAVLWRTLSTRHHFPSLSYYDIVLPWRWSEYRRTLGKHYIELGRVALKEKRPAEAAWNFQLGLVRNPEDWETRCELARLLNTYRKSEQAIDLMMDRIDTDWIQPGYLRLTLGLLKSKQKDQTIIELAKKLLPPTPTGDSSHAYFAMQAAEAFFREGDYVQTDQWLKTWKIDHTVEGTVLLASVDSECGYPELALLRLKDAARQNPADTQISRALLRTLIQLGQHEEAQRVALHRYSMDPFNSGPRIDLLAIGPAKDNPEWRAREIDSYLRDYADNIPSLVQLGDYALKSNQPEVIAKIIKLVTQSGKSAHLFRIMQAECLIRNRDFTKAREILKIAGQDPAPRLENLLNGFQAVVAGHLNEAAGYGNLVAFKNGLPSASESLRVAQLMADLGDLNQAQRVLLNASSAYPDNQGILTRLVELDLKTDNRAELETHSRRLLALPKPSREILEAVAAKLTEATAPEEKKAAYTLSADEPEMTKASTPAKSDDLLSLIQAALKRNRPSVDKTTH